MEQQNSPLSLEQRIKLLTPHVLELKLLSDGLQGQLAAAIAERKAFSNYSARNVINGKTNGERNGSLNERDRTISVLEKARNDISRAITAIVSMFPEIQTNENSMSPERQEWERRCARLYTLKYCITSMFHHLINSSSGGIYWKGRDYGDQYYEIIEPYNDPKYREYAFYYVLRLPGSKFYYSQRPSFSPDGIDDQLSAELQALENKIIQDVPPKIFLEIEADAKEKVEEMLANTRIVY